MPPSVCAGGDDVRLPQIVVCANAALRYLEGLSLHTAPDIIQGRVRGNPSRHAPRHIPAHDDLRRELEGTDREKEEERRGEDRTGQEGGNGKERERTGGKEGRTKKDDGALTADREEMGRSMKYEV